MSDKNYKIYITPLESEGVYGTERDMTDYVRVDGAGVITRAIDSTDFDVGIFTVDDVTLVCENADGRLSDESDGRSIFQYKRDLAKVRIVYNDGASATTTFRGFLIEEASRVDPADDAIYLQAFSRNAIFRKLKVPEGAVTDGLSFKNALIAMLNGAGIAGYLALSSANLNLGYNGTVDRGSEFDKKQLSEALDDLLLAANSVLAIDEDDNIIVKSRWQSTNDVLYLHGKGDLQGRENCRLVEHNSGLHRCFNSWRITGGAPSTVIDGNEVSQPAVTVEVSRAASIAKYGVRQKQLTLDFLTAEASLTAVGKVLLSEFAWPKMECLVSLPTSSLLAQSPATDLLDQVSLNYPLRVQPTGKFLPVAGITTAGDADSPLPSVKGAVQISEDIAFKVISIEENPSDFSSTLKLRQVGISPTDGVFDVPLSIVTITEDYEMLTSDDVILVDTTAADITITRPDPSLQPLKAYTWKKIAGSNKGLIAPAGSEQTDGTSGNYELIELNQFVTMVPDGANWRIIAAG